MKKLVLLVMLLPLWCYAQNSYKKINGYKFLSKIDAPKDCEISPGQFSKDFKKYYLPVKENTGRAFVYFYQIDGKGKSSLLSKHEIILPEGKDFAGQVSLTEDEKTIVFTVTNDNSWANNELCIAELENKNKSYVKTRILGELNEEEEADAYPTISSDGLRIFWVSNDKFYTSSRKERNHAFRDKTEIRLLSKSIGSAWISPDETFVYLVSSGTVYVSERKNTNSVFAAAEIHSESFQNIGFISGYNETKSKIAAVYVAFDDEDSSEIIAFYKKK